MNATIDALTRIAGSAHVLPGTVVGDAAVPGVAATLVQPASASEVAAVVAWCYADGPDSGPGFVQSCGA